MKWQVISGGWRPHLTRKHDANTRQSEILWFNFTCQLIMPTLAKILTVFNLLPQTIFRQYCFRNLCAKTASIHLIASLSEVKPRICLSSMQHTPAISDPCPMWRAPVLGNRVHSPIMQPTFVGKLALDHSYMTCFWAGILYVAEQLFHCNLLKAPNKGGL